ncbi:transcription factor WhiB [Mycolicibacterium mageritense DSM 44476 = CIP 104973]|uniref:4Fe-4S Wbl-type domain-containing protein n=1 Tax=Mycolicibacterium mageritense TaxID=53462 RepID=A0ABM7HTN2_MYCME|nr:hypothetical protein MMAGJ_32180 [Mycolicibacterium mageritense]
MNSARVTPGALELLVRVLKNVPRLDGAACIGARIRFWEAEMTGARHRIDECVAACRRCPVLERCRSWAATQRDLTGVWAGKFYGRDYVEKAETCSETG